MRIPRVFFDGDLVAGSEVELSRDQAHYLGRVLRLSSGRPLLLFNGLGGEYSCEIAALDGKRGLIKVLEHLDREAESTLVTCLAIGLSKGDRFDWALQKATELGVTRIQPLFTDRTEVRLPADRLAKKQAHWQAVVQSACEQSGRTIVPEISNPIDISAFCEMSSVAERLILDPDAQQSLAGFTPADDSSAFELIVGPEGGLSAQEIEDANGKGWVSVSMGPRVLRTETAPIVALAVLQSRFGDW